MTQAEEAAALLRGLKSRVDRLEQSNRQDGVPHLIRTVSEDTTSSDTVTTSTNTASPEKWDTGKWDSATWG